MSRSESLWSGVPTVSSLLMAFVLVYILKLYKDLRRVAQSIKLVDSELSRQSLTVSCVSSHWPGRHTIFSVDLLINRFLPAIPGVLLSADYSWTEHYGSELRR